MSKTSSAVKNRYNNKNYDRITVVVPKGVKNNLVEHAKNYDGGSLNAFIKRAISETIERDKVKK